ncbi:glycosyltransferase family 2 protein [Microvirga sp. 0TCS3.31]
MRIAAITMVYNERLKLPLWLRHYAREVGIDSCYVVDHGSTDGSTANLGGANIIRLPRSPQNNELRTKFIGELTNSLLKYYDYVLYTDCDELLVADPRKYAGLKDYCTRVRPEYTTSIGLDVLHKTDVEGDLDPQNLISLQRSYVHYSSAMNKPNLTSTEVVWSPGFHSRQTPAVFNDIFLFHLRYVDLGHTLDRLAITRSMDWMRADAGAHQRVTDDSMVSMMRNWGNQPVVDGDPFSANYGILAAYLKEFKDAEQKSHPQQETYWVNTILFGKELLRLPAEFRGSF